MYKARIWPLNELLFLIFITFYSFIPYIMHIYRYDYHLNNARFVAVIIMTFDKQAVINISVRIRISLINWHYTLIINWNILITTEQRGLITMKTSTSSWEFTTAQTGATGREGCCTINYPSCTDSIKPSL
jgi:hypothetical protein